MTLPLQLRVFTCQVQDGGAIKWPVARLPHMAGKEVEVHITQVQKKRSQRANRYYWGVCISMIRSALREAGMMHTAEETHQILKYSLGRYKLADMGGNKVVIYDRTPNFDTKEFSDYIEAARAWAAENLGIDIPDPPSPDDSLGKLSPVGG